MTHQFKNLFVLFILLASTSGFAQNLLSNGNFESGSNGVGFNINSCCYNEITPPFSGTTSPGNYAVTNNPQPMSPLIFLPFGDHTTGSGNMLVVDGTNTGGQQRFWRAGNSGGGVCGLTVGTTYTFSFWIRSASNTVVNQTTQAQINIQWNNANNVIRTSTNATTGSGDVLVPLPASSWQQVVYTFVPTNACVNIEMYNNNTNLAGNDFAMDDVMVMAPPQPLSLTYSITNPTCPTNTNATIFGYGIGGTPPYTNYALSGPVNIPTSANGQFTGLAPGNYSLTVTDSNSGTHTQNGIIIPNAPDMTLTATQTTICAGASTTITASGGMTAYNWTSDVSDPTMAATGSPQTVSPTQTTTYTVTSTSTRSENLIYNGDFFLGNVGFTSDYTYYATNTSLAQKAYGVVANSNTWETAFTTNCPEHTGSPGSKMLVVDGSTVNAGNDAFWCQTIPVNPSQNYTLTYYLQALAAPTNASIQVKINGVVVGTPAATSTTLCTWTQPTINWNSGASTTANICFYDLTTTLAGNDFAIDDITFSRTNNCNLSKSITITVTNSIVLNVVDPPAVCAPGSVDITAASVIGAGSTTGTTFSYWTNAAGTIPMTFAAAQNITVSGTYYIKSTLGSCSVIKPVVVSVANGGSVPKPTVTSPVRYCVGSLATPLTATAASGATLNWYDVANGGSPLAGPPTPITAANGITSYFVSQTIGGCESLRQELKVYVGAQLVVVCDPSQVTTNPVSSVFFDWANIPGPPVYNYSYSINGGPAVTGSTNISSYEVFGVAPGQSVVFTILSANGYPCINPVNSTCGNCVTTTTPTFTLPSSICSGTTAPVLPTTSDNGIIGTWNPSVVSNTSNGSYLFTPDRTINPCANNFTKTISVANPPSAGNLSGNQNICAGTTTPFSSSVSGGTWSSNNPAVATVNTNNGIVTGITAGNAIITYTVNGTGGCANATETRTVNVTAAPAAGTLSGNQNICIGQTTSFITSVSGGSWSSNNTAIATINASGVITAVSAGTAAIVYTVAGSGGCTAATVSRNIIVSAPPIAGTLSGNQSICVGSTTNFTPTVSGGTWSSTTPSIASVNATTGVITGVASGTTNIDYTITGTGGCSSVTVSRSVTVTNPVSAGTLSGNQNICVGNTTTFIPTVTGGTWSSSNTAFATVNNLGVVTGVAAGTATITYTVSGTGGCANAVATRNVSVAAIPSAGTLNGNQNVCIGFSTNFSSTVTGGTWSSSNTSIATVNAAGNVIGVSAGTAVITYTVAGTNGCANGTNTRNIFVSASPSPGILSGNQSICQGQITTFNSTVTGGTWSSSNTAVATIDANTGIIGGVSAGSATMTYTVAGTGGCTNVTATRTLTVNPNIVPTFNLITHICQGETIPAFPTTSNNGITGTWSPAPDNMNDTTYTFTPTAGQCAVIAQQIITIDQPVTPLFDLVAPVCLGATAPILPTSSNNTPPITGTWSPATVSTASVGSALYTFIPNPGQCVVTTPTRLMVTVLPIVTPDFPALSSICEDSTPPVLGSTSPNGITGTWSPATVSNTIDQSYTFTPTLGQCANSQTLSMTLIRKINPDFAAIPAFCKDTPAPTLALVSPNGISGTWFPSTIDNTVSGDFDYVFTPDATQCANSQTLTVTITEPTIPDFSDFGVCVGSTPPILSSISPNGVTGTWVPPVVDNILSGTYEFTPTFGQCATNRIITVTVNQYTLTSIDGFVTNYFDENQIVTILATDVGNYLYQLDDGPPQEENTFQNVSPGIHTIKVIDANGCSSPLTDQVLVVNYPKFFTPNDDSYNDTWNIEGLSDQEGSVISIFDRFGKLIKQISPKGPGWDGTYNGERMPSTDYWFTVEYTEKGARKTFKSHFSLKR